MRENTLYLIQWTTLKGRRGFLGIDLSSRTRWSRIKGYKWRMCCCVPKLLSKIVEANSTHSLLHLVLTVVYKKVQKRFSWIEHFSKSTTVYGLLEKWNIILDRTNFRVPHVAWATSLHGCSDLDSPMEHIVGIDYTII